MTLDYSEDSAHGDAIRKSLGELCGEPMEPRRFLRLAICIATELAEIHAQNFIHKNISSRNILINPETGAVTIANSPAASRLSSEYPATRRIAGTLAYMSPEQTGRMNRVVDYRTDLYSLGVTFYEMLTGRLPFQAGDALEWVHCHIARAPRPPADNTPGIPRVVSDIVIKLLAKTAEERYQTASGLKFDLERCLQQLETMGDIEPFALGEDDISDRLLIPQKLYGREKDIENLLGAFQRVVERAAPEMVMVAGYSGIGKTSLVRELCKPIIHEHGLFISGKFDQYKRDVPYSTIAEAFRELIQQILTESEERIAKWRKELQSALGVNGQLIVDIIPQVELIIGRQPPVPDLPLTEARNQFDMVFRQFLGIFATKEHPLVVFLDDLQWVDSASLKLLEHIITYPDITYLLLIGAYRDNEVSPTHPLMLTLDSIRKSQAIPRTITLSPLSFRDLSRLITETLASDATRLDPLVRLIYEKTAGNPFFAIQFLMTLHDENMVEFDKTQRRWTWDIARIEAKGYTDNVVDLMVGKLRKLSPGTQRKLRLASCIGNRFHLYTLAVISNISDEEAEEALWEALREGVLLSLTESSYTFLHDRVQQAAYSLISEEQRMAVHLRIGRLMLESAATSEARDEGVFDIVNQFNLAAELIHDQDEKYRVAELNLLAGMKARAATANASAINYFSAGMALLAGDSWEARYELTHRLHLHRAECEYLNGSFNEAERLLSTVLNHAGSKTDIAAAARVKVLLAMTRGRNDKAVEAAVECLRLFGVEMSPHPTWEHVREEYEKVWERLGERSIEGLIALPDMTDPDTKAVMEVLSVTITPAVYTDKNLLILVLCHMVSLTLSYGIADASASGFVWFGVVLGGPAFREFRKAFRFGKLAYDLVEKRNMTGQKGRVFVTFASLVNPWTRPLGTSIDILRDGFDAALQAGDLTFACYGCQHLIVQLVTRGDPLSDVYRESEKRLDFVRKAKFGLSECVIISQQRLIQNLRGLTNHFSTFSDARFDQDEFEAHLAANQANLASAAFRYYIRKLQARFMSGDLEEALHAMAMAKELLWTSPSFLEVPEYYYYGALALASHYEKAPPEEKPVYLETLEIYRKQFEDWPTHCPENFLNKYALVCAEIARITGRELDAERFYEQAIQSAKENGFVQNEGIANELASKFFRRRGFGTIADAYLREARTCYVRWGAEGKVKQLDEHHPWLFEEELTAVAKGLGAQIGRLDAIAVVKASQAISGEIVLSNLLEVLMSTMIENAGAQKACLILAHGDEFTIEAKAKVEGQEIIVIQPGPSDLASVIPMSMVNFVRRTRERVILEDASGENMFSSDPYIVNNKPISVLCLPLLRQANLIGLLYLENSLVRGAFTTNRIAVIELLAAQAAISLENAALYLDRSRAEDALRRSEEKYRAIFESSGTALMFIEEDMTISICNKEFEKLSGYTKEEVEGRKKWTEIVAKQDDLERMKEYHRLRRADPQAAPQTYEFQFIGRAGKLKDVVATVATMPGMKQSLAALLDISERKQVVEALHQSERKFRAIFDQTFQFMGLMSTDGTLLEANRTALTFCGLEESDVIGKPFWDTPWWTHSTELQDKLRAVVGEAAKGESVRFEATHPAADGSFHYIDFSLKPVWDEAGNIVFLIPEGRDITDRKQAEEERVRLVTAIEQAGEGVIVTDTDFTIRYVNPAFERMSGYDKDEIVGLHNRVLKSDKHDGNFFKNIRDTLVRGEIWSGRLVNKKKDGAFYEVEATVSPVRDSSGAVISYVGIHRDITHEARLERELRQAQKMEVIGTLAGGIAHDFNNILTGIMGYTEMALRKTPGESPIRYAMERVLAAAYRAADLVKQILTFSRQAEKEMKPIPIAPIVKETLKLLRSSLPTTIEMRQEIAISPEEGVVLADSTQIHQVLMNLCTNAAHAMHTKGGILTVKLSAIVADASFVVQHPDFKAGPYVCVTVSDTGEGMDPGVMERIFDPYFTTKKLGEGTGIGLAVVAGIVESHGGAITVYSEPGQGAVFRVFLPRIEEEAPSQPRAAEVLPAGSERILFVDDEVFLVELGGEMLGALGYRVTAKTSSIEALQIFRAQPHSFDLVITDMTMPGLTGKELAKELLSIRSDIPIILNTGFSDLISEKEAREIGIRQVIMKPYVITTLARTIRKVLEPV